MKPTIAKFDKEHPCTKRHLWECFATAKGFRKVAVPEAQSIIGINAPRGMEREGRLSVQKLDAGDFYVLTSAGQTWLVQGIQAYVKNHPLEKGAIRHLPSPTGRLFSEIQPEMQSLPVSSAGRIRRVR